MSQEKKNIELIVLPGEGHGFSPKGSEITRELVLNFMENTSDRTSN